MDSLADLDVFARIVTSGSMSAAGRELGSDRDPAALRKRVETLEIILERSFVIPGINRPVGLDAIVGLVPVVGDVIAGLMGAYLIWEARNLGMPKWKLWRMAGNVAFDSAVGAVPLSSPIRDAVERWLRQSIAARSLPDSVTVDPLPCAGRCLTVRAFHAPSPAIGMIVQTSGAALASPTVGRCFSTQTAQHGPNNGNKGERLWAGSTARWRSLPAQGAESGGPWRGALPPKAQRLP